MTLLQNTSIFEGINTNNVLQKASQSMSEAVSGLDKQVINPLKAVAAGVQGGIATIGEAQSLLVKNLSEFKSSAIDKIDTTLRTLTGGLFNINDIGSIVTYKDGFKINTDELLRIGSKGLGFNISSLTDLKQQIGDGFLKELNNMTFGLASGVFRADGTKIFLNDDWKFTMGNSIMDFLGKNDPDGFGSIINVAGLNAILNTMLNETIKNGVWQGYSNFGNMYTFQSDYHDALIDGINNAIGKGDLESINTIFDIIQKEGINKVKAKYPNLIEDLLTSFQFTSYQDPSDYGLMSAKLLKIFLLVGGPDWYKYPTQHGMAINVGLVGSISNDAKILLNDVDELVPLLCASGMLATKSALDVFTSDFSTAVSYNP